MSTKENEGRKIILGDNPIMDENVIDRMISTSQFLDILFDEMPFECSMTVMIEWMHRKCHQIGLYFPDFLESTKTTAEMIENDDNIWF